MYKNILVAIDESEMSNAVLDTTLEIAEPGISDVTLLFVGREFVPSMMGVMYVPETYLKDIDMETQGRVMKMLKTYNERLKQEGIIAKEVYLQGDPAKQILQYAKDTGQEMIIIGSRGLSGVKEMLLGSVSHKVAQLANCPVFIVH
ncbi:universal stress protein [Aciduricibacillus chroicocephali]|uniref:Universal stress protein n=1 Tax=Aciduricibacillus chroicocephali TaxID=3054939 RepID=A0ABY9KX31_9BACI|nr:universal stress protein [Bacillaceae bacterium 44XB]